MATIGLILFMTVSMYIHEVTARTSFENLRNNSCITAKDCAACMERGAECIWCLEDSVEYGQCQPRSLNLCLRIEQSTAESNRVTVTKNHILRPKRLISPQKINLLLNKGASSRIVFFVYSRKPNFEVSVRHSKVFKVTVQSQCKGFEWKRKKASCKGVTPGRVEFKLEVELIRCPKKPKKIKVTMKDKNRKRSLKIKVTTRCSCDCHKDPEPKSVRCSEKGNYVCGSCECEDNVFGKHCECDPEDTDMTCSPPGEERLVCSGRGECICGQCNCHAAGRRRYSGRYCECDDYACDYHNGYICGGPTRGRCSCGQCVCNDGYSGTACQADLNYGGCLSVRKKSICNNVGLCINNKCQCLGNNMGPTCDECSTDPWDCTSACVGLKECVQCFAFRSGRLSERECHEQCSWMRTRADFVDSVSIRQRGGREFKMCMLRDDDGCLMKYGYDFTEDHYTQIAIETTKMCPEV